MTNSFRFIMIATNLQGGSSWNVTPIPNVDVCEKLRESIHKTRSFIFSFPRAGRVRCIEAEIEKPVNPDALMRRDFSSDIFADSLGAQSGRPFGPEKAGADAPAIPLRLGFLFPGGCLVAFSLLQRWLPLLFL